MNSLKTLHAQEPAITWGTLAAVFNALQLLALPGLPLWVHTVIVVLATIASVLATRHSTVSIHDPVGVTGVAQDLGIIEKVAKDV